MLANIDRYDSRRQGMTLVELLVVIFLVTAVSALTIPIMNPNTEGRRMRETARMIDTYIQGARDRTLRTGRPVGVMFERDAQRTTIARSLSYVAMPPPYQGDSASSRVTISNWVATAVTASGSSESPGWTTSQLVRVGDLCRFNFHGQTYLVTAVSDSTFTFTTFWQDETANSYSPVCALGVPYQVFRQPIRMATEPMKLPDGYVVDLQFCGTSLVNFAPSSNTDFSPVVVMFNPGGSVDRLYFKGNQQRAMTPVHFLLGKSLNVENSTNLTEPGNLWVTVYPQTGRVKTDEMATIDSTLDPTDTNGRITSARRFALSAEAMTE